MERLPACPGFSCCPLSASQVYPCADLNAVVWSALEAPLPDVADLGFCSVPDCTLAPELVGALDWGLLPPAQKLYQIGPCTRHDRETHPYTDLELDF